MIVIWNPFFNQIGRPLVGDDLEVALQMLSSKYQCILSDHSWSRVAEIGFTLLSDLIGDMLSSNVTEKGFRKDISENIDEMNDGVTDITHDLCRFVDHLMHGIEDHHAAPYLSHDDIIQSVAVLTVKVRDAHGKFIRILPTVYLAVDGRYAENPTWFLQPHLK